MRTKSNYFSVAAKLIPSYDICRRLQSQEAMMKLGADGGKPIPVTGSAEAAVKYGGCWRDLQSLLMK